MQAFKRSSWALSVVEEKITAVSTFEGRSAVQLEFSGILPQFNLSLIDQYLSPSLLLSLSLLPNSSMEKTLVIAGDFLYLTVQQGTLQIQANNTGLKAQWVTAEGLIPAFRYCQDEPVLAA